MKMPAWLEEERDEKASLRAKSCWPSNRLKQDEVRSDFKVGFDAAFVLMAAERDMLRAALDISGNACGIAPTFLAFHGNPSKQLNNCIENMRNQEATALAALEKSDRFETPAQNEET